MDDATAPSRRKVKVNPTQAGWILACLLAIGFASFYWKTSSVATTFPTPYQTVLLSNGAVYYGKLQGYGTVHPVMTEVFYIVSQTNPETKQVSNVLVKRGKELHGPDRMYLNPNQIVFVEPVGASSKVAQLIGEAVR
jgi:hypothetical protein